MYLNYIFWFIKHLGYTAYLWGHLSHIDFIFSYISYTVGQNRLRFYGTGGVSGKVASAYYMTPITSNTYIGVNRRYSDNVSAGSGVCRMRCYTSTFAGFVAASDAEIAEVAEERTPGK